MFYHPSSKGCKCPSCVAPCHPPLYAWFPCQSGCSGCSAVGAGGRCKPLTREQRIAQLAGRFRCKDGHCGEFKHTKLWGKKYLTANGGGKGGCDNGGTPTESSGPAVPPAPPVDGTLPAPTVAYKRSPDASGPDLPAPKPLAKRPTTYRPNAIAPTMPVLSPDQFRKPPKQK
jgi:hypothetical protein